MLVSDAIERIHLLVGDFNAFLINSLNETRGDAQAGPGRRGAQILQDYLDVFQHNSGPMFGDLAEQAVFDWIPL